MPQQDTSPSGDPGPAFVPAARGQVASRDLVGATSTTSWLESEHASLRNDLLAILEGVRRLGLPGARSPELAGLVSKMREFEHHVREHFAAEERSCSGSQRSQEGSRWTERLASDHRAFEARLADLAQGLELAHAEQRLPQAAWIAAVHSLASDLREHELAETRVWQIAVHAR